MEQPENHDPKEQAPQPKPEDQSQNSSPSSNPQTPQGATNPDRVKGHRRRRRSDPAVGLERIAEVHYCRSDGEANQYLALGAEWDLQDILPTRVETDDGGERDEVHYIVVRWENERDRARLRGRDRGRNTYRRG